MVAAPFGGTGDVTMSRYRDGCLRGFLAASSLLLLLVPAAASGADKPVIEEVIVTAQKQKQVADTVGMSIAVATGASLQRRGIDTINDLTHLVSGLTIQHSAFNSTSFTLRGVGFFNSDMATPAAVTVYVDEAPLAYPAMTHLVGFDLARVEVMKGPQGTLFGKNAIGGTIRLISKKPQGDGTGSVPVTLGSFNSITARGAAAAVLASLAIS